MLTLAGSGPLRVSDLVFRIQQSRHEYKHVKIEVFTSAIRELAKQDMVTYE